MATTLIGSNGSMGLRYQAILKHLNEPFYALDKEHSTDEIFKALDNSERVILCTPTETHYKLLKSIIPLQKPILCEKPITKSVKELEILFANVLKYNTHFTMMFQYSELVPLKQENFNSSYNYFRTGKDGLIWDCLQIIGLAKGEIEILNDSPIWKCRINGKKLSLHDMDQAYVAFVNKWKNDFIDQNLTNLYNIHIKTERMANELNSKFN